MMAQMMQLVQSLYTFPLEGSTLESSLTRSGGGFGVSRCSRFGGFDSDWNARPSGFWGRAGYLMRERALGSHSASLLWGRSLLVWDISKEAKVDDIRTRVVDLRLARFGMVRQNWHGGMACGPKLTLARQEMENILEDAVR